MPYSPTRLRPPQFGRASLLRVAQAGLVAMQARAFDRGLGVDGAPLAPYSARYGAKKRAEVGHGRVDLTQTGAMRRSLRVAMVREGGGRDAQGRFRRATRSAVIDLRAPRVPDYAVRTNQQRPWFGFGDSERRIVARAYLRERRGQP